MSRCEWNPDEDRIALSTDEHHRTTRATVLLGSDQTWHLCQSCSELPRFSRFRRRRALTPKGRIVDPVETIAIGDSLKWYRLAAGLSIDLASRRMSASKSSLHRLERGEQNPSLMTLARIAKVYGVRVSDIVKRAEEIGDESKDS